MSEAPCVFCDDQAKLDESLTISGEAFDLPLYDCPACGRYVISEGLGMLKDVDSDVRFRLACLIRERRLRDETGMFGLFEEGPRPTEGAVGRYLSCWWTVQELLSEFPTPTQLADRTLLNLSRKVRHPMETIALKRAEVQYVCFSPPPAARRLLDDLFLSGLLREDWSDGEEYGVSMTLAGCQRVEDLTMTSPDSRQAFIAMWFAPEMDKFYGKGIRPAVERAGYDCRRIDLKEHNNKICDEIVAEIRKSRFVVADVSGNRQGVYFEAGYGMAMGLPVIWTVREEDLGEVHFDTRQYNHIVYESSEELQQRLYNRIAATIH